MKEIISNLQRRSKISIALIIDFLSGFFTWFLFGPPGTIFIAERFSRSIVDIAVNNIFNFIIPIMLSIIFSFIFGFYSQIIRFYDSSKRLWVPAISCLIFGLSWSYIYLSRFEYLVPGFLYVVLAQGIVMSIIYYSLISTSRALAKSLLNQKKTSSSQKKIIIYGAGSSGTELYQALAADPEIEVVAFFDDSKDFSGVKINNIDILVNIKDLENRVKKYSDVQILLSIPSISIQRRREIISKLEKLKVEVRSIPALHEIVADRKKMTDIQPLSIDDILPRKRVEMLNKKEHFNKSVLVTGAGGSIGSEISRQLFSMHVKKIILFDISEFNLFSINKELNDLQEELMNLPDGKKNQTEIIPILGDIKDRERFRRILSKYNINTVYHAAAYKHVPLVEYSDNVLYSIQNNIFGTLSVMKSCLDEDVASAILVSTDKAVRPTNIMGATKRFAEQVVQSLQTENKNMRLSMVRFGNVINSSGSVIPLFRKQISNGGPLTVTHKDVTRYFMTIPEASSLVIQAEDFAEGGEVFLLDMGEQVKIFDLAKKLIHLSGNNIAEDDESKGIQILEVGLRPGEKLFEELLISGDEVETKHPKIFKSIESFPPIDKINEKLDRLKICIEKNDTQSAIEILIESVEGFEHEKF
tara:strand:+ start:1247 stop:3169 length:1923 start_codon:yes stop_codon:yes gene_type:complete